MVFDEIINALINFLEEKLVSMNDELELYIVVKRLVWVRMESRSIFIYGLLESKSGRSI